MTDTVRVMLNYKPSDPYAKWSRPGDEVFIDLGHKTDAVVSPDEARRIAAKLVEVADEFDRLYDEANKPKFPTNAGAVIKYEGEDE